MSLYRGADENQEYMEADMVCMDTGVKIRIPQPVLLSILSIR